MNPNGKKWLIRGIVLFIAFILFIASVGTIGAGEAGVKTRFGAVSGVLGQGIYFKIPFIEHVTVLDTQVQKEQVKAEAASSDLQIVHADVAVNYTIDESRVGDLYAKIGLDYKSKVIDPAIQEAVKASTAKYTAGELITKRPQVQDEIRSSLVARLQPQFIEVGPVSVINFDFSDSFNKAIEAKVTAEQNALASKNLLEQKKYEAEQTIVTAQAQAEAIKIQAQAINSQGGADYVQLQLAKVWDGHLPTTMVPGGALPFLNIK